jgi:AcrR family transcriptional regulator
MANQDRETPGRRRRDETAQDRDRTAQGRDRTAQDRDRTAQDRDRIAQGRDRTAQDRDRTAQGRDRTAQNWERPSGGADLVSDDLWSPLWPTSSADRGSRARRMPASAERERARGQDARGQDARGQGNGGRGRRRAAPSLSRAEIVDAAIAVADAEGSDAISMRRIAQVLRSGTMSLYWHVANKEQLLDLMLDVLITEVSVPEPSGDWQADLRALARNHRAMLLRHRWAMDFVGGRPPLGPNTLLNLDRSLALLDGIGLDVPTAMNILMTVLTYVMGAALREMREMRVQRDQEQSGITAAEWEPVLTAWRDRLADDGRFSRVVRFLDEGIDPDAAETRDERFEFGLDCVIDGIAAKVAESGRTSP